MDINQQRTGTEMLEDLASIAFSTDQFPTSAEASVILAEEGIDPSSIKKWTLEKMRGIKARQKLAAAREKRVRWENMLKQCMEKQLGSVSLIREAVLAKLRVLGESDPDAAQVYCRKFEAMNDADLPELEAELSLLDFLEEEKDGS